MHARHTHPLLEASPSCSSRAPETRSPCPMCMPHVHAAPRTAPTLANRAPPPTAIPHAASNFLQAGWLLRTKKKILVPTAHLGVPHTGTPGRGGPISQRSSLGLDHVHTPKARKQSTQMLLGPVRLPRAAQVEKRVAPVPRPLLGKDLQWLTRISCPGFPATIKIGTRRVHGC